MVASNIVATPFSSPANSSSLHSSRSQSPRTGFMRPPQRQRNPEIVSPALLTRPQFYKEREPSRLATLFHNRRIFRVSCARDDISRKEMYRFFVVFSSVLIDP
ncbi:hypothetical protein J6590_010588 [Homalodisca vitripennis]|nr:hypothetical protein J6590_010588 [Homalodisca vitripennis]